MTDYINNKTIDNKYKCFEIIVNIPSPISAEKVMNETGLSRSAANVYLNNLFDIQLFTKVRMGHVNLFYRTRKQLNFDDCAIAFRWEEMARNKAVMATANMNKMRRKKGLKVIGEELKPFEPVKNGYITRFDSDYLADLVSKQAQQRRDDRKPQGVAIGSTFGML